MRSIEELRIEIDRIDKEIVDVFERRMEIVEEVAAYKIANNKPLKDPKREADLINKNVSFLKDKKYERLLRVFYKDLMEYSRTHQNDIMKEEIKSDNIDFTMSKVAYQGIEGSFSSIALKKFFGNNTKKTNVLRFDDAFQLLNNKEVDYTILPIENSSTGAINEVYDLLTKYPVYIIGEVYLSIVHNLIGIEDSSLETIGEVYSHEQGFKQSKEFLKNYNWKEYNYFNTAKSVKHVSELNRIDCAAIGSKEAAEFYDLKILKPSIQDNDYNTTRFVILSNIDRFDSNANKISLLIRISHEPRSLFKILKTIADHKVNMLKIESRPVPDKPWEYIFYIDIEGSIESSETKNLLKEIEDQSHYMLMLGNYINMK